MQASRPRRGMGLPTPLPKGKALGKRISDGGKCLPRSPPSHWVRRTVAWECSAVAPDNPAWAGPHLVQRNTSSTCCTGYVVCRVNLSRLRAISWQGAGGRPAGSHRAANVPSPPGAITPRARDNCPWPAGTGVLPAGLVGISTPASPHEEAGSAPFNRSTFPSSKSSMPCRSSVRPSAPWEPMRRKRRRGEELNRLFFFLTADVGRRVGATYEPTGSARKQKGSGPPANLRSGARQGPAQGLGGWIAGACQLASANTSWVWRRSVCAALPSWQRPLPKKPAKRVTAKKPAKRFTSTACAAVTHAVGSPAGNGADMADDGNVNGELRSIPHGQAATSRLRWAHRRSYPPVAPCGIPALPLPGRHGQPRAQAATREGPGHRIWEQAIGTSFRLQISGLQKQSTQLNPEFIPPRGPQPSNSGGSNQTINHIQS